MTRGKKVSSTPSKSPAQKATARGESAEGEAEASVECTSVDYVCPLCIGLVTIDPVVIHTNTLDDGSCAACIACRSCAMAWTHTSIVLAGGAGAPCPLCSHPCGNAHTTIENLPSLEEEEDRIKRQGSGASSRGGAKKGSSSAATLRISNVPSSPEAQSSQGNEHDAEVSSVCGMCEEAQATLDCTNCSMPLCEACRNASHSKGKFKDHIIVDIGGGKKRGRTTRTRLCPHHPEEPLSAYCITCSVPACVRCCFSGVHKGHDVDRMYIVAEQSMSKATTGLKQLEEAFQSTTSSASLAGAFPLLDQQLAVVKSQINEYFNSLRCAVDQRENTLLNAATEFFEGKKAILQSRAKLLEETHVEVAALCKSFEHTRQTADSVDFMMVSSIIEPRICHLMGQLDAVSSGGSGSLSVEEVVAPVKDVVFNAPRDQTRLQGELERAGTLVIPQATNRVDDSALPERHGLRHRDSPEQQGASPPQAASLRSAGGAFAAPNYSWKMPSLNIATQLPTAGAADGPVASRQQAVPSIPGAQISKRKQFLNLGDELDAGEPTRKSGSRATGATLSGLSSHFLPKRQGTTAAKRGDGDAKEDDSPQPPAALNAMKSKLGNFELRL